MWAVFTTFRTKSDDKVFTLTYHKTVGPDISVEKILLDWQNQDSRNYLAIIQFLEIERFHQRGV